MTSWKISTGALAILVVGLGASALSRSASADQPTMQTALDDLNAAKTALGNAERDHGGHREKAMKATDLAIAEVQAGIAWAERHKGIEPGPKGPQPKGPQPKN